MERTFETLDYLIFAITLLVSAGISFYFGCFGNKQKHAKIYLYGSGNLSSIPIGLSLLASAFSALAIVGVVQEVYVFGIQFLITILGILLGLVVTSNIILPVFCGNLNLTAPYEYFERRFNSKIRSLLSVMYCLHVSIYPGIILYASTISFSEATGIKLYICTTVIGLTCTIYTIMGGFSGVIWTDVLQTFLMFSSCIFILCKGIGVSGGFINILYESNKGGRLDLFNFDPSPFVRISIWSGILGFCVLNVAHSSCAASGIQRYMALHTEKEAKVSASIQVYGACLITLLSALIGLCTFVYYKNCDPLNSKQITHGTQLLAFFVDDIIGSTKGFIGLFNAGLLSAGLSSLSAELNAVSGLMYYDILQKIFHFPENEFRATVIMKVIVLVYGLIMVTIAPLMQYSKYIYQLIYFFRGYEYIWGWARIRLSYSIFNYINYKFGLTFSSLTYGAKFGVMMLATCFPKTNSWGAFSGILAGVFSTAWISINALFIDVSSKFVLPRSTENCSNFLDNTTIFFSNHTNHSTVQSNDDSFSIYKLSYLYYPVVSVILTISVGIIVSYITGVNDVHKMDTRLIIPCVRPGGNGRNRWWKNIYTKTKNNVSNNESEMQPL